jgi:hypothetical protein
MAYALVNPMPVAMGKSRVETKMIPQDRAIGDVMHLSSVPEA